MPALPGGFLRELAQVYEAEGTDDSSLEELGDLGARLDEWAHDCQQNLREALKALHPDHPVKCPISLFGTMDFGRLEAAHTRALAWLLDPKKEHGFGNSLVNSLLNEVHPSGERQAFWADLAEAERFYHITAKEDTGRTDVWIEGRWGKSRSGSRGLIVIEAKVDASEGKDQLDRYDLEITKAREEKQVEGENVRRIFLTADGREPTTGKHWKALSFSRLARAFCEAARSLRKKPGHHYLRFYAAGILKDILHLPTGACDAGRDCNRYRLLGFLEKK